jgi:aspartate/tyrosine/aromatic aminotransferase
MGQPTSSTTTPLSVILTGDSTWHIWVELLKTRGLETDIWKYIDPNTLDKDLPSLIQPVEPTFKDVYQCQVRVT